MLGWSGMDISPDKDGSIEKNMLRKGTDMTSPNDGALVNGMFINIINLKDIFYKNILFFLRNCSLKG